MVIISEQVAQSSTLTADTAAPKPKRQRQRNRPRNKRNRIEDNDNSTNSATNIKATPISAQTAMSTKPGKPANALEAANEKTREQVMAEREAKKQAKQAKKQKSATAATQIITEVEQTTITTKLTTTTTTRNDKLEHLPEVVAATPASNATETAEKTREQIKAEREAKKAAKHAAKTVKHTTDGKLDAVTQQLPNVSLNQETKPELKKPALSKAERRALQEAQRAAKAQAQTNKSQPAPKTSAAGGNSSKPANSNATVVKEPTRDSESPPKAAASPNKSLLPKADFKVKLFNHLVCAQKDSSQFINDPRIHPSMARLGEQYAKRIVVGSNARCIAFLNALRQVVQDFETPAKKEFGRSLDVAVKHHVDHLNKCRPLAVSVSNAYKQFRNQLTQLPADAAESELKELLTHFIDTYVENQIGKAAQAISSSLQEKITDGDVLLTFGCSSLIHFICEEAKRRQVAFRVIVVDSRPTCPGQEMLRRLHAYGIPCTYVLINAVSYVMPEATKVLLGAHALLANGYVMARTGTAQVALVAHAHNVPVLVCCETHKFSERFQTDAIVYNELGDPNELIRNDKCCLNNWQSKSKMTPLNLNYDITPPELVSAVVTEVAILPCTSVPVILRIKPEIGY